jgi:hypothetical protein
MKAVSGSAPQGNDITALHLVREWHCCVLRNSPRRTVLPLSRAGRQMFLLDFVMTIG